MTPTDLPRTPPAGEFSFQTRRPEHAPKPPDCAITEEAAGDLSRFTIAPQASVVPAPQLIFAFLWAGVWTLGIVLYVLLPNTHGPVFNFLALLAGLAGEYLALMILLSALTTRLALEQITLGPGGVVKQTRLGPLTWTRRVALPCARAFRIDAFPMRRGSGGWTSHLYLLVGKPGREGEAGDNATSFRLAEGARDEDKYWLASRLNAGLRTRREGLTPKI